MIVNTNVQVHKHVFEALFERTLAVLGQPETLEVTVALVGGQEIREYNLEKRGVDEETDVLSFPNLDICAGQIIKPEDFAIDVDEESGLLYLGDIAICESIARAQATEYGHSFERELGYLCVHAYLHLFGFDHTCDTDKSTMRETEERILAAAGLSR